MEAKTIQSIKDVLIAGGIENVKFASALNCALSINFSKLTELFSEYAEHVAQQQTQQLQQDLDTVYKLSNATAEENLQLQQEKERLKAVISYALSKGKEHNFNHMYLALKYELATGDPEKNQRP